MIVAVTLLDRLITTIRQDDVTAGLKTVSGPSPKKHFSIVGSPTLLLMQDKKILFDVDGLMNN